MFRYVWDKVWSLLPVSMLLAGCGTLCYVLMKKAGEEVAAWVGLATIGIAVFLLVWISFRALLDVMRWRRDFVLAEALDEYKEAEVVHHRVRLGRERLFFNTAALEYDTIHSLYCTYESHTTAHGEVQWWFILNAIRLDGKKFRVLLIQEKEKKKAECKAEAITAFTRILDVAAQRNPQIQLTYPHY